jgi:hypothetical protein
MDLAAFFAAAGLRPGRPSPVHALLAGADHDPRLWAAFRGHTGQLDAMNHCRMPRSRPRSAESAVHIAGDLSTESVEDKSFLVMRSFLP